MPAVAMPALPPPPSPLVDPLLSAQVVHDFLSAAEEADILTALYADVGVNPWRASRRVPPRASALSARAFSLPAAPRFWRLY